MENTSDRRAFFKNIFSSASDFLKPFAHPGHMAEIQPGDRPKMESQIMGDLTPELLAMEAGRLGLDPQKDQNRVLQSIQAAMDRPDIKKENRR